MKIIALYKLFRGHEFLRASLESIYNHVDAIVAVTSTKGWDGKEGNTTLAPLKEWKSRTDRANKLHIIETDFTCQDNQYITGMEYINKNIFIPDWVLLIDSDEVWTEDAWENSFQHLKTTTSGCLGCYMETFVRTAMIKVLDKSKAQCRPTVFIRPSIKNVECRGATIEPKTIMENVIVKHYSLVRESVQEIIRKLKTSFIADKHPLPIVDIDQWLMDVYQSSPGKAYHYYGGCQHIWDETVRVSIDDVPLTVQRNNKEYL